jgi:hypothetical protein
VLTAAGSPLVNGASPDAMDKPKVVRVKVLRPFLLKLVRQEVGAVIDVPRNLASELASANKVEILKPQVAAEAPDLKPEAPAEAEPKATKGARHARQ